MGLFYWFKYLTHVLHLSLPGCMYLIFDCVLTGHEIGVSGPILSQFVITVKNNCYLLNITLTFDRFCHGSVAVVLVRYEMVQRRHF